MRSAGTAGDEKSRETRERHEKDAFRGSLRGVSGFARGVAKKRFNDRPFPYHAELELEISTLTNLGAGLGRVQLGTGGGSPEGGDKEAKFEIRNPKSETTGPKLETQEAENETGNSELETSDPKPETQNSKPSASSGWVVMVPFALPGERVRVRIFRNHKNYSEADLVAVHALQGGPLAEQVGHRR